MRSVLCPDTADPCARDRVRAARPHGDLAGHRVLPEEIAFLRRFGVRDDILHAATRNARRAGTGAAAAAIAMGGITDTLFFFSLAKHVGLPFLWRPASLARDADAVVALRTGRVRLADGSWLAAPDDAGRRALLRGLAHSRADRPALALTTPARFAALIGEAVPEQVADAASTALVRIAPRLSAHRIAAPAKSALLAALVGIFTAAAGLRGLADACLVLFCTAMVFRLLVCAAGLSRALPSEAHLGDAVLPTYSVLVPLYREAGMVPSLVGHLEAIDYPRAKLEILFLTERDDRDTRAALNGARLPPHMRVVTVPDGWPRTKPRALNTGLMLARGEFVTVYDAEDRPDPDQLRAAALRFRRGPADLACLQARLAIATTGAGLLVRLFAQEYAALFDLYNVGATRCGIPVAIGGTSNHFRAAALRRVGGWDAFNVTEDADLGLRLARFGYAVGDLPSTTIESGEESLRRWFNQRRRWMQGWMQTALVFLRDVRPVRELGVLRWSAVVLLLTNLVIGPLLTPFALLAMSIGFARHGVPAPHGTLELAEATLATSVFVLGIVGPIGCGFAGMRRRGLRGYATLLAVPVYQMLICAAAWGGWLDLLRRPHDWRKTPHTPPLTRSSP